MDYTTLTRVKNTLGAEEAADDTKLVSQITGASREIDRRVTGTMKGENYFARADVIAEVLKAQVDEVGNVVAWLHKCPVNTVSSFEYRRGPLDAWVTVDTAYLDIVGIRVTAWVDASAIRGTRPIQARVTYNGGYSVTADGLPADLVEAATVLTIRFYREGRTGLTDSIGVAELGTTVYTKALPVRVKETINQLRRPVPW